MKEIRFNVVMIITCNFTLKTLIQGKNFMLYYLTCTGTLTIRFIHSLLKQCVV